MTTIKKMWLGKKKLKSLIGFLSANKIDNYNRGWKTGKEKRKKIQLTSKVGSLRTSVWKLINLLSGYPREKEDTHC